MNISRLFNTLALFNPFAVQVMARGNALVAYRNVFGVYMPVSEKREQLAVIDYIAKLTAAQSRITKAMIGAPFAFVDPVQGQRLNILLTPPASPTVKAQPTATRPSIVFAPMSAKLAGKRPAPGSVGATYLCGVDRRMAATAAEAYRAAETTLDCK